MTPIETAQGSQLLSVEEIGKVISQKGQPAETLANLQFIWSRPVNLETVIEGKPSMLSFDGSEHTTKPMGESDENRRSVPAKTR